MESKNNTAMYSLIFLAVGIFIGWLVWGSAGMNRMSRVGMHKMPDGSMMSSDGMSMDDMMHSMTAGLIGKSGDAFDQAFIEGMIVHHEGAVAMAEMALQSAKHAEIKTMANAIISTQTNEINQMKQWLKDWYSVDY